jgi:hypothetical protein
MITIQLDNGKSVAIKDGRSAQLNGEFLEVNDGVGHVLAKISPYRMLFIIYNDRAGEVTIV